MTDDRATAFGHLRRRRPDARVGPFAKAGCATRSSTPLLFAPPTRAALITGRNHHSVGSGVIAELSRVILATLDHWRGERQHRQILRERFATSWFGKNHNTPAFQYSVAGPFDQWPSGLGFEYFYGFIGRRDRPVDALPVPRSFQIFPWVGSPATTSSRHGGEGHQAHARSERIRTDKPFFLYYVPAAPTRRTSDEGMDREVQRQVRHGL